MKDFNKGILFTVGVALFGRSMYRLGKLNERRKNAEMWKATEEQMNQVLEAIKEKVEEKTEEEA